MAQESAGARFVLLIFASMIYSIGRNPSELVLRKVDKQYNEEAHILSTVYTPHSGYATIAGLCATSHRQSSEAPRRNSHRQIISTAAIAESEANSLSMRSVVIEQCTRW